MKGKTVKKNVFIAVALSMLLALSVGTALSASAESKFNQATYDKVGEVVVPDAVPDFMKISTDASGKVRTKMKEAYRSMTEGGFDMGSLWTQEGEGQGGIRQWQGYAVQEFRGGDHTADWAGRVHGYIVCGTAADGIEAGCVVNDIMLRWVDSTGSWGYPIGNQFTVAANPGYLYQNFINGYVTLKLSYKRSITFKQGKFLTAEGQETTVPIAAVPTGQIIGSLPSWAAGKSAKIKQAFIDAEQRVKTGDEVKVGGYDLGVATDNVTPWLPENLALTQPFGGGDNDGNPYGWVAQGRLMLSDPDGVAFPLVGGNLTRWASLNGFRGVGYPLSYPFTVDGLSYQIFSKAYFVTDELGYIENVTLYAGAMDFADKTALTDKVGTAIAQSNFMAVYKNYNNTGANLGIPDDYMRYTNGVFMQTFTAPEGGKNYLVQKGADNACVMVTGKIAATFGASGIGTTGAPRGNAFTVNDKTVQNFEKGYIDGEGKFVAGKSIQPDGSEAGVKTVTVHPDVGVLSDDVTSYPAAVKDEFIAKVRELNELGTFCYEPVGKVREEGNCAVQEFCNTASSAKGNLLLVKTSKSAPVCVITDVFYNLYVEKGGFDSVMDPPSGDRFCFGGRVYQNFRNGFATVDSANVVTYTLGQNVSTDGIYTDVKTGAEINPVPDNVGVFGDINRIPVAMRPYEDKIRAAFSAEYARLMKLGFYPGEVDDELVHQWAPSTGYAWINQTFKNGDSTAEAFGNNSAMKIFMTDVNKGAFSIYSEMLTAWIKLGSINSVGYPTGNQFVYNGDLYQNFTEGYVRCPFGMSTSAEFVAGQEFVASQQTTDNKGCGCGSSVGAASGLGLLLLCGAAVVAVRRKKEA